MADIPTQICKPCRNTADTCILAWWLVMIILLIDQNVFFSWQSHLEGIFFPCCCVFWRVVKCIQLGWVKSLATAFFKSFRLGPNYVFLLGSRELYFLRNFIAHRMQWLKFSKKLSCLFKSLKMIMIRPCCVHCFCVVEVK